MDSQLEDAADSLLDRLGLLLSSAAPLFQAQVVDLHALPFPAHTTADVRDPLGVPLHVHIEVMLEEIAAISARLHQMAQAVHSPDRREALREIGKSLRAIRFQFDPYNETEVMAMVHRVGQYSQAMQSVHS
jgi:antitoxin component of RelBE/YafQ-DinJ toxin-antitoxin module